MASIGVGGTLHSMFRIKDLVLVGSIQVACGAEL